MKKFFVVLAVLIALGVSVCYANTSDKITVLLDGAELSFDVEPVMENNRVLVPFRKILESLGCSVRYTETDGKPLVTAHKGDEDIRLYVGGNTMYVNSEEVSLDVTAKILNGRTLVPLRAVSSAFEAEVDWNDETQTVIINSKQGEHYIGAVTNNREIKNDEGVLLVNLTASYPVIKNDKNDEFVDSINAELKAEADTALYETAEIEEAAKVHYAYVNEVFMPYELMNTYVTDYDKSGFLSITSYAYSYWGGAHGITILRSKVLDLTSQKILNLTDILNCTEEEIDALVIKEFSEYFLAEGGEDFLAEWGNSIAENVKEVKFRLTENGISLYFDVYAIAPYAFGTPEVTIPYNEELFKINI